MIQKSKKATNRFGLYQGSHIALDFTNLGNFSYFRGSRFCCLKVGKLQKVPVEKRNSCNNQAVVCREKS